MSISNSRTRYGTVAMTLHWVIAVLILVNICLGLYFGEFVPDNAPPDVHKFAFELIQIHKPIGLTILVLSILRLLWRLVNPVPPLPQGMSPALKFTARATHFLLYFLIIAIPLSGWIMVSASRLGLPTSYFGLFQWPNVPFFADLTSQQKHAWHETFESTHSILAWSVIVLIPIHVTAALWHQFRGDDVLRRMIPGTRVA